MDRQYAREYYELERRHWWFLVREKILNRRLSRVLGPNPGRRNVLNIGAATGRTSEMLAEFGEVTTVEFDPILCEFLRQELNIPAIQASITELPFEDGRFDLICAFDVIEHVQDHEKAAAELTRVCRPGGHVALTVPAFQSLWSHHDEINHHFRRYRTSQLQALFQGRLQLQYSSYFNSLLFVPVWLYRRLNQWVKPAPGEGSGSDFEAFARSGIVGSILSWIFSLEIPLLDVIRFPVGVSLLHLYRKGVSGK